LFKQAKFGIILLFKDKRSRNVATVGYPSKIMRRASPNKNANCGALNNDRDKYLEFGTDCLVNSTVFPKDNNAFRFLRRDFK